MLVEVAGLVALAGSIVLEVLGRAAVPGGTGVALAVFFLGVAALLALAARALHRGRRWGRGPVLTWQLLLLAIGVSQLGVVDAWLALVLVVVPVLVVVAVLLPPSRAWADSAASPDAVL